MPALNVRRVARHLPQGAPCATSRACGSKGAYRGRPAGSSRLLVGPWLHGSLPGSRESRGTVSFGIMSGDGLYRPVQGLQLTWCTITG